MKKVVLPVLALMIVSIASGAYYFYTSPEYALMQVKASLHSKDKILFEKHVDLKSISESTINELSQNLMDNGAKKKNVGAQLGSLFGAAILNAKKSQIEKFIHQEFERYFDGKREVASNSKGDNQAVSSVMGKNSYIGHKREECGPQVCSFKIQFHNEVKKQDIFLNVKLEKKQSDWRIVQVPHILETFNIKL